MNPANGNACIYIHGDPLQCVPKGACRGDHWSSADFALAKSIAARQKYGYFPSGNPKNVVFRRTGNARPYK